MPVGKQRGSLNISENICQQLDKLLGAGQMDSYNAHQRQRTDWNFLLLKIMTLALIVPILHSTACRTSDSRQNGVRPGHGDSPATTHDPHVRSADPVRRPPQLSAVSRPDYHFSHIPAVPTNVRGNLHRRPARNWKYIVVHHSATESGGMRSFDRTARVDRGWKGVGYHFVIGNGNGTGDGMIEVTFRWDEQIHGAHAGVEEYNEYGIGICLVGDFDTGHPTRKQIEALASLTNYLQERNSIPTSEIWLHRGVKNTACPGKNFPFYQFLSLLKH